MPSSSASSPFVPLVQNTVRTPPSKTGLSLSLQRLRSIAPASPLPKRDLPSPKTQQTDAKKRRASNNNDESAVQKRSKTSNAPRVIARQIQQYDENDVRAKAPEDWDQVKLIQQVLESTIRSFARVTGRTPPSVSPWLSYRQQRDAFQQTLDRYWEIDERPGQPPELAGIGPCYGPLKSIIDAHVVITEDELEYATHPTVASYQPVPGSIAWLGSTQNFEYLLQNQLQPRVDARSTGRRYHGIRPSAAQPMSLQVDHQAIHAEGATPYRVGTLVARKIEEAMPAIDRQYTWPMQFDEVGEPPYLA